MPVPVDDALDEDALEEPLDEDALDEPLDDEPLDDEVVVVVFGTHALRASPLFVSLNVPHTSPLGQPCAAFVGSQYGVHVPFIGSVVAMQMSPSPHVT